jgi:hypothetical protein
MVVLEPHRASQVQALPEQVVAAVLLMERVLLEQEAQVGVVRVEVLLCPQPQELLTQAAVVVLGAKNKLLLVRLAALVWSSSKSQIRIAQSFHRV